MKILVANPNTSTGVTERLVAAGRLVASPGTELLPMTAPRGVPYIATRAEAAIGSAVMLEMLAERRGTFDAAIVAAFGDPGLGGARELFDFPVVGMAEAAMLVACTLGRTLRHRELRQGARTVVRRDRGVARHVGPMRRHPHARRAPSPTSTTCGGEGTAAGRSRQPRRHPQRRRRRDPGRRAARRPRQQDPRARAGAAGRRHPGRRHDGRGTGAPQSAQGHRRHLSPAGREGLQGPRAPRSPT